MDITWTTGSGVYVEKDAYNTPFYATQNNRPYQFCIVDSTATNIPHLGKFAPVANKDGHKTYVGVVYDIVNKIIYNTKTRSSLTRAKKEVETILSSLEECLAL